jgi:hypothetical protein
LSHRGLSCRSITTQQNSGSYAIHGGGRGRALTALLEGGAEQETAALLARPRCTAQPVHVLIFGSHTHLEEGRVGEGRERNSEHDKEIAFIGREGARLRILDLHLNTQRIRDSAQEAEDRLRRSGQEVLQRWNREEWGIVGYSVTGWETEQEQLR